MSDLRKRLEKTEAGKNLKATFEGGLLERKFVELENLVYERERLAVEAFAEEVKKVEPLNNRLSQIVSQALKAHKDRK